MAQPEQLAMFDGKLRPLIDPPLNAMGRRLARAGVSANQVTLTGFLVGLLALPAIIAGWTGLALLLLALNRFADGLDGAVARASALTDQGGYLDIVLDFLIYAAFPLAFALADPGRNALPAAVLLFAYMGTASSFLAFAVMAAKRGIETSHQGKKSLYYLQGLAEGAETIAFMLLCCLLPDWFPQLAYGYAALCLITTLSRILLSLRLLDPTRKAERAPDS